MSDDRSNTETTQADQQAQAPPQPQAPPEAQQAPQPQQPTSQADADQQPQQAPAAQASPQAAAEQHHSRIGGMFSSVFRALGGGPEVEYAPDANGKMVATPVPQKPGDWAKRLIAGALTGLGAGAQVHNPGAQGLAGFGAGFGAERAQLTAQDQQKQKVAAEDFDRQQATLQRKAQIAHLTQETAKVALENTEKTVEVDSKMADMSNALSQRISQDPQNKDMGIFRSMAEVEAAAKMNPDFLKNQAHGRIVTVPHYSKTPDGKWISDGFRAAMVTDAWKDQKLEKDTSIDFFDPSNGKWQKQTLKAGSHTNGEAEALQMSQNKVAAEHWGKAEQLAKTKAETEKLQAETKAANMAAAQFNVPAAAKGEDVLTALPPTQQAGVRGLANYEIDPATFPTRPTKGSGQMDRATAISLAKRADPSYDETQYKTRSKIRQDYSPGGAVGQNLLRINTAVEHLSALNDDVEKLGNTWLPAYNTIGNWMSKTAGRSKVTNFKRDAEAVAGEIAGLVKGGKASATDEEIKAWKDTFNVDMSHTQLQDWIAGGVRLMGGRLESVRNGWESGMGKPYDFKLINPDALQRLSKLPGHEAIDSIIQQGISTGPRAQKVGEQQPSTSPQQGGTQQDGTKPPGW